MQQLARTLEVGIFSLKELDSAREEKLWQLLM